MDDILLHCIVVDDSRPQRLTLKKMIQEHPNLVFTGEYGNAIEAKKALSQYYVDLVFLDVEMPVLSGFDLLDGLSNRPEIIIVSGKTQYAFKAYNYNAIDYIHKPVSKARLYAAVDKALNNYRYKKLLLPPDPSKEDSQYIYIKSDSKRHKILLKDIRYFEAMGDYAKVVTENESLVTLSSLKAMMKRLPEEQFFRIHKTYIVNLNKISMYTTKEVTVGDKVMPLSRHKKKLLHETLYKQ